jgi:hypothetical protein
MYNSIFIRIFPLALASAGDKRIPVPLEKGVKFFDTFVLRMPG